MYGTRKEKSSYGAHSLIIFRKTVQQLFTPTVMQQVLVSVSISLWPGNCLSEGAVELYVLIMFRLHFRRRAEVIISSIFHQQYYPFFPYKLRSNAGQEDELIPWGYADLNCKGCPHTPSSCGRTSLRNPTVQLSRFNHRTHQCCRRCGDARLACPLAWCGTPPFSCTSPPPPCP